MSKELVRTCNLSFAQHLLNSALELSPSDPIILNELGVILLKNNMIPEALNRFKEAIALVDNPEKTNMTSKKKYPVVHTQKHSGCEEIFSNFATCLRKCGHLDEALVWYERCLGIDQNNANTHANIAFTYHTSGSIDKAILSYHRALSLESTMTICQDMMGRAIEDSTIFPNVV
jgi:anaphase-promoting complex subunit 6